MPRPATKDDLLTAADMGFAKLQGQLDAMPPAALEAEFAFDDRDRNVRDVLVHLYEWHRLLLEWIKSNTAGRPQPFLPAPYNWKTYGEMNVELRAKHQDTPLAAARTMVTESHAEVMRIIAGFSNEDLFTKRRFTWTGTSTLGSYCVSVTSSHYDWALKKIKRHRSPADHP